MERIALQKLIDWNENQKKKPLIVWGARQVGKTYLVKDIIRIIIFMLTVKLKMKFVSFAPTLLMQKKSSSIFPCSKVSRLPKIRF